MKLAPLSCLESLEPRLAPAGIIGVNTNNQLILFDSATPGSTTTVPITGLTNPGTETIRGIDFRPATGELYALGITDTPGPDEGRIYIINPTTGVATPVGATPFSTTLTNNNDYAFDINPSADRIRVVTDRDENLRIHPDTGALLATDTVITPNSEIVGTAYSNNFTGAATTTLYGIDRATSALVTIGGINGTPSPNGGVLNLVGALGVAVSDYKVGFDIESRTGLAYAVINVGGVNSLYTINLATGAATLAGAVGAGNVALHGLAVSLPNDLTIVNNTTATYIDQDGDKVTVKITGAKAGASLGREDFVLATGEFGSQLRMLNLADDGQEWAKASITINAVPVGARGDSFANVGYINATGVDLGKVTVNGDLGQIDAGNAADTAPGLAALTVQSMGVFSNTQPTSLASALSNIEGKLGSLTIKSDMNKTKITVTGADGAIGTVLVGGDVDGRGSLGISGISSSAAIGNVTVNGSVYGGSTTDSGLIRSGTTMGKVTVGGSVYGGSGSNSGVIESGTHMGAVLVKGSIVGGTASYAGGIHSIGNMTSAVIKGSILGGNAVNTGILYAYGASTANIGSVKIGGNLEGASGSFSGSVYADTMIKSVVVSGFIQGGSGGESGNIEARQLGTVNVGGDALGGSGTYSGSVYSFAGSTGNVTIGGSLIGGNALTGIISANQLGAVKIVQDMQGARISALGGVDVSTAALASAIKSVSVGGSVQASQILGGYDISGNATNADATVGAVTVGGNWIASSLAVGAVAGGDVLFGTADDTKTNEALLDNLFSKIGSVTIKGYAMGTVAGSDHFGIVAEQIGTVKIGGRSVVLAPDTDTVGLSIGATFDLRIREV